MMVASFLGGEEILPSPLRLLLLLLLLVVLVLRVQYGLAEQQQNQRG
jgi:hypothetical protein